MGLILLVLLALLIFAFVFTTKHLLKRRSAKGNSVHAEETKVSTVVSKKNGSSIYNESSVLQGGKYRIIKILGQGGFGITYLAHHTLLGTDVAVKEFFMKDLNNRDKKTGMVSVGSQGSIEIVSRYKEKFLKEARRIYKLNHPNIVRVLDVFEENGTAYYVMELCNGGSLSDLLSKSPTGLEDHLVLKYIRQVASALQYIHDNRLNHLDVKPANILINSKGDAVLVDFGLSKQYDSSGAQTSTTPVGLSHGYAPMEQYKQGGVSEFSPATDIYALGATLYKLVTGKNPPEATVVGEEGLPSFEASQPIRIAIERAMQWRRNDRPQSVREWLSLLDSSQEISQKDISMEETTLMK